jgi:hypothetical protein
MRCGSLLLLLLLLLALTLFLGPSFQALINYEVSLNPQNMLQILLDYFG